MKIYLAKDEAFLRRMLSTRVREIFLKKMEAQRLLEKEIYR